MEITPTCCLMGGREHSITMFLLPEGTTVGSRLKWEDFQWELI